MNNLILNGTEIRVDEFGRYCLTDLWKAGGSIETKKPSKFEKTERHSELVEILKGRNLPFNPYEKTRGRYNGGTWTIKEMIIAYAIYVSADMHMKVIDVFISAVDGHGDKAVAIAQGNEELKSLLEQRDRLILTATSQSERNEIERLTNEISKHTKPSAQKLAMMRGKGKKFAESELDRINGIIQLDIFNGSLNGRD